MNKVKTRYLVAFTRTALAAVMALAVVTAFANSEGDRILHEIDGLKKPELDRSQIKDEAYVKDYRAQVLAYRKSKYELISELFENDPSNPKTAELLTEKWVSPIPAEGEDQKAAIKRDIAEIDAVLAQSPSEPIREAADYSIVILDQRLYKDPVKAQQEVNFFVLKYPKAEKSPSLLYSLSFDMADADRITTFRRILTSYPDFKEAPMIRGALRAADAKGKPFALSFTDAVSGKAIDLASMKGKVVLVDFWATWCGPCVAEMPQVKAIYGQYHDKGLEIVGVSLDEPEIPGGGLTKLKDFVAKNQIPWPMYYQGNGWDSKFSSDWGIMSIPTAFLVDKQGNFQGSVDARDSDFNSKIEKLLSQ
jgi:thiol-disulfide isomerase/thioredoxin